MISKTLEHAKYVLSQTPEMLPVLKQAGVVDSGGQGLVEVLSGAFDALLGKEIDLSVSYEAPAKKATASSSYEAQADVDIKFGYCAEFIIMLNKVFNINIHRNLLEFFLT